MVIDRKTVAVFAVAVAVGWWLASSPVSPVGPQPEPNRPVVNAIAKLTRTAARLGLWFALAADPPPTEKQPVERQRLVRAGESRVDHAEGW